MTDLNQPSLIIEALARTPDILLPLVREAPAESLKRRPAAGKWSIHEHACHLADVHPLFFDRLERMLRESHPRIEAFAPDPAQEEGLFLAWDLDEALERFSRDRARLVECLEALSLAQWRRTAEHEEYAHYSLSIMFRHLSLHDLFHAYRIEDLVLKRDWA